MSYSLGKLGYATGKKANDTSQTALDGDIGNAQNITIQMQAFTASFSTALNPNLGHIALGVSKTWNLVVSNNGNKFLGNIGNQTRNATWSDSDAEFTVTANNAISGTLQNTAGNGNPTNITLVWNDHYNPTVTAIDSVIADA